MTAWAQDVRRAAAVDEPVSLAGALAGPTAAAATASFLGSLALLPVFATAAWLLPSLAAVVVVALGGLVLRVAGARVWDALAPGHDVPSALGGLGVVAVPVGQLVLLTCLMTGLYAPTHATLGLLPGPGALRDLAAVLGDGTAELREQATPALPLQGLLALSVLAVGAVAVVVDLIAVGGRQPALAGLGLLVLYCIPVSTVTGSIGLVPVAAPAAGLALLLWSDQRRVLSWLVRSVPGRLGTGALSAVRTAALALVAALVLGSLLPTLAEGTLASGFGPGRDGARVGTALDPVAELRGELTRPDPIALLRVRASVRDLGYLRAVVLDQYDAGRGWVQSNLDGEIRVAGDDTLAPLPARTESREVTARITALGHDDRYLPVLYSPLSVSVDGADDGDWRFDAATGTVFGRGVTDAQATYEVTAAEPRPSDAQLADSAQLLAGNPVQDRDTALPALPPQVTDLVASLTAGATTPYERVRAIHAYLTDRANGFIYSLSTAPGTSGDDLVDFLQLKRGYCEQYAGAMAVMVRAAGVPARVVLGYTPGSVQPDGSRLITTDDAHAWVEAYFEDLGWVPFDPTPLATSRLVDLPWAPRADATTDPAASATPTAAVPSQSRSVPSAQLDRGDNFTPLDLPQQQTRSLLVPLLWGSGAVLLLVLLVGTPAALRAGQRRRRLADGRPTALWDELVATARDLGVRLPAARTPRQTARDLAARIAGRSGESSAGEAVRRPGVGARRPDGDRAAVDALRRLALAEEAASYGRDGAGPAGPELAAAVRTARRGLVRTSSRVTRLRAALWPASLVTGLAARLVSGPAARLGTLAGRLRPRRRNRPRAA